MLEPLHRLKGIAKGSAFARPGVRPVDGAVAQLGERVVRNDEVSGSIPLSSTTPPDLRY